MGFKFGSVNSTFTRLFLLSLAILVGGCSSYDYPLDTFSNAPVSSPTPVNPQDFVSLRLEPLNATVPLGFSQQFSAVGAKSDGSSQDLSAAVSWTTENPAVATVDDSGLVTGKAVGNTRVIATLEDLSASSEVIVSAAKLVELKVNPENGSFLTSGAFYQLTATGAFSDGSTRDLTEQVSWTIGTTPEIATISDQPGSKGQVKSKGLGSAKVKVQLDSIEAETSLTFVSDSFSRYPGAMLDTGGSGGSTRSVTLGDLNADGISDIVTANYNLNNVSVLLGKGDGTFQAKQDFGVGSYPSSVTLGDLNADGISDIVTANYGSGNVSALLGNGDGTFQAKQDFGVGTTPLSVTLGDLNADGISDLVTANYNLNNVSVLLGKGDGTFQAKQDFGVGSYPSSVTLGDLNADGISDIVTANYGSGNVSVLLGNGDGTFQAKQDFGVDSSPWSVTLGDLNADGISDIVTANYGSGNVSVLLGISNH